MPPCFGQRDARVLVHGALGVDRQAVDIEREASDLCFGGGRLVRALGRPVELPASTWSEC